MSFMPFRTAALAAVLAAACASSASAAAPNLSLSSNGGSASASSTLARYPLAKAVDGARPVNADFDYWNDGTQGVSGDWIAVSWTTARQIGHVTLRLPVLPRLTAPQRTIGRLTVEYLDGGGAWRAVTTTNGQPNPIVNWTTPTAADGSQIKELYFAPVATRSVRVRYDGGNSDGWAFLEELETYESSQLQDYEESISWLRGEALRVVNGARLTGVGGTTIFAPDGVAHYQGQWTRDWEYALEGYPESMSVAEQQAAFNYIAATQRADGQIPTLVTPGGAPIWGPYGDDTDNAQFLVKAAWEIYESSGDISHFRRYAAALSAAMNGVPRDATTGLVWIDPANPHSSYGFTDSIRKTGNELFCSLLYVEASKRLEQLYTLAGDSRSAATWAARASTVQAGLATLWNSTTGLFDATSIAPRPDVWGSAYAVVLGLATPTQQASIANWLRAHYAEVVENGQLRHLPGGIFWNAVWDTQATPGRYQNGGFWGTATGWAAYALATVDPGLARQTVIDMARYYREVGPYEASRAATGYLAVPEYVASVTAPLAPLETARRTGPGAAGQRRHRLLLVAAPVGDVHERGAHERSPRRDRQLLERRHPGPLPRLGEGRVEKRADGLEGRAADAGRAVPDRRRADDGERHGPVLGRQRVGRGEALNGEPNPVVNWVAPTVHDGRAVKTFAIAPVATTAVRVLFDAGNVDGWSFLEELEVYGVRPTAPKPSPSCPRRARR